MQLASYEEDFKCERVDRTRAVEERLRIEQEFNDYKNASVAQFMQLNKRVSLYVCRYVCCMPFCGIRGWELFQFPYQFLKGLDVYQNLMFIMDDCVIN